MNSNKVWFWLHFGLLVASAIIVVTSFALLGLNSNLLNNSIQSFIIFLFVMPGVLLVYGINQLILWRRKAPRVIRTIDKVVIIIFTVFVAIVIAATFEINGSDVGLGVEFIAVPLLIVAGITSTIVIAVGNMSPSPAVAAGAPGAATAAAAAPVAATLDQLYAAPAESAAPATPAASAAPAATTPADETPYGPKS